MKLFSKPISKVLIVGKLPLPIGGVRIHVQRLIEELEKREYAGFQFYDLDKNPWYQILFEIMKYRVVHLHTSNSWFQLLIAGFSKLFRTRLIITYHSNWGRYNGMRNVAEALSAFFASVPIVQNEESLSKANRMNKTAVLMSTFIPPVHLTPLVNSVLQEIQRFKNQYRFLFCTNAWNVTFDKKGREIYGITELIKSMERCCQSVLIISDPSGQYQKFNYEKNGASPDNVFWISEPHDFWHVLLLSHAFIRNTTTDGTSLSIQEALLCGTLVFASAAVSRAPACITYQSISTINFEEELEIILEGKMEQKQISVSTSTVDQLLRLYHENLR
jgi:glycosyltransferase involved in cell wall biosynthesis